MKALNRQRTPTYAHTFLAIVLNKSGLKAASLQLGVGFKRPVTPQSMSTPPPTHPTKKTTTKEIFNTTQSS